MRCAGGGWVIEPHSNWGTGLMRGASHLGALVVVAACQPLAASLPTASQPPPVVPTAPSALSSEPGQTGTLLALPAPEEPTNSAAAEMVFVPPGSFWMGCAAKDRQCNPDEKPLHLVTLDAFYIDKTEVTVGAYRRCVSENVCHVALRLAAGPNSA
jgi:formylglycine-generating enzyme required for sulfatase activity